MVQNKKRLPGRPRAFDSDAVLDQAMRVFWQKGYEGATVDDLTEATGLSRPSLYNAYGDKEALFLRSLERYGETIAAQALQSLAAAESTADAVHAYLRQIVLNATGDTTPHGCLGVCVAMAVEHSGVRAYTATGMAHSEEAIAARLKAGIAAGELPADFPVVSRARRILDLSMALALRARAGTSREELLSDAADGAAWALLPPR